MRRRVAGMSSIDAELQGTWSRRKIKDTQRGPPIYGIVEWPRARRRQTDEAAEHDLRGHRAALGTKVAAIEAKLKCRGKRPMTSPNAHPTERPVSELEGQIERDLAHDRDLTEAICGDPLNGY
jgi:hypothetical protein